LNWDAPGMKPGAKEWMHGNEGSNGKR